MNATCPACKKQIHRLSGDNTGVSFAFMATKYETVVFKCPECAAVLGAQVDPIALKTDIVEDVIRRLRSGT